MPPPPPDHQGWRPSAEVDGVEDRYVHGLFLVCMSELSSCSWHPSTSLLCVLYQSDLRWVLALASSSPLLPVFFWAVEGNLSSHLVGSCGDARQQGAGLVPGASSYQLRQHWKSKMHVKFVFDRTNPLVFDLLWKHYYDAYNLKGVFQMEENHKGAGVVSAVVIQDIWVKQNK